MNKSGGYNTLYLKKEKKKYDLEDRLIDFAVRVIT